jgi:hypothetical protein
MTTMDLDESWINEFEKTDKLFCKFYKEDNYYVDVQYIYINKENEIETTQKETLMFQSPNVITREELISLLKKNMTYNNKQYNLLTLLNYNIDVNPEEINAFLNSKNTSYYNDRFLKKLNSVDTIFFDKTINMYQDLNNLFIIFYENSDNKTVKNTTKKIYLHKKNTKSL